VRRIERDDAEEKYWTNAIHTAEWAVIITTAMLLGAVIWRLIA
jgi:hypothetical protein